MLRTGFDNEHPSQADISPIEYPSQADISPIDEYLKSKSHGGLGHRFKSGIGIGGGVVSSDEDLNEKINLVLDKVVQNILKWESEQL